MRSLVWLYRASIWHPDAIPPDEWKFRSLKRVWIPLYDLVAAGAGIWALFFGSPILHRLFANGVVDFAGGVFAVSALVCLAGISFPRLWRVEIIGKLILLALLGTYAVCVAIFRSNPDQSALFVCFILVLAIPLPLFRLTLLGEEIKDRSSDDGES